MTTATRSQVSTRTTTLDAVHFTITRQRGSFYAIVSGECDYCGTSFDNEMVDVEDLATELVSMVETHRTGSCTDADD